MRSLRVYKSVLLAGGVALAVLLPAAPALAGAGTVWSIQSMAVPTIMHTSDDAGAYVTINASGGTFTLEYEGQKTGAIAYNARTAVVEAALDSLSSIGGVDGSATVAGGLGSEGESTNEHPYRVMFAGKLQGVSAAAMTANGASLTGGVKTVTVSAATNDEYDLHIENIGDAISGGTITVTDELPTGVITTGTPKTYYDVRQSSYQFKCGEGVGLDEIKCESQGTPGIPPGVSSSYNNVLSNLDDGTFEIAIPVEVEPGFSGEGTNTATVSGGSAVESATVSASNRLNSSAPPEFGVSYFNVQVSNEVGAPFTQAGGHPYALTTSFGFNEELAPGVVGAAPNGDENGGIDSVADDEPREIAVDLPLGLVGNPMAAPRCPLALDKGGGNLTKCPRDSEVGIVYLGFIASGPTVAGPFGLYNITPESGHPGEFAFNPVAGAVTVLYGSVVRTHLGNVVRVTAQAPRAYFHSFVVSFFGNPIGTFAQKGEDEEQLPFLINPTNCQASEAQRTMTMHVDSWYHPGEQNPNGTPDFSDPNWKEARTVLPPVTGCNILEFDPSQFELAPSGLLEGLHEARGGGTTQADQPSAYEGHLKIPQLETFGTESRPELKNATVTLPAGLSVSASAANGLEGCSEEQLDPESGEPGKCPEGSELGSVEVTTPLLEKPLDGHVYLAEPKCGEAGEPECHESEAEEGKLFGLIMELDGLAVVKIPGKVEAGGYGAYSAAHGLAPGQLRAVFENDPQLPFGELVFHFKEGERTPLANPQTCGTYTTTSVLEPWSAPFSENATSQSPFSVSWDGKGGACPSTLPFAPGFTAGMQSHAVGQFSPFVVRFERQDREQDLSGITVHTPAGMLADLAGVPLCAEAQANAGTCSAASQIGTTSAAVGPGSDPFWITDGRVYLTEGYKGGSFGLSVVVPANAGPFHFGNVVVRASIAVNPSTAALTVTSNPLPQVVDSVPIRLRTVEVDVNRPGFMFNATSCAQQHVEATLTGLNGFDASSGSSASVSYPYAAGDCGSLRFTPKFSVSTSAKTSKADGASLIAELSEPSEAQGDQANVARVKVELPEALPSRLTTLQKACTDAQFEANPAACPAESKIGSAVVHTPLLPVPLEGPAIFVSHGGEAFPSLTLVLQGDGVTIDLVGTTFISKAGVTSTTFKTVPDAPFSTFALTLPEGKYSALTALGNLCTQKLTMPSEFVAQNGAEIHQSTSIEVEGCSGALAVSSHKIKGRNLTLSVYVPAAGKVKVSAKGLSSQTKTAKGHETMTFKLHQKRAGKLKTKIKLTFAPMTGKRQHKSLGLRFKR